MNTKNWKLKDVLLIAISAVLFGVVYLGCTYIGGVLYGMLTPFGMASLAMSVLRHLLHGRCVRHLCHARFLHDDIRCLCRDSGYADMDVHNWMFVLAGAVLQRRCRCCAPNAIRISIRAETSCSQRLPSFDPYVS